MPRRGRTRTLTRAALLATAGLLALSACGGEQAGPKLELSAALPDSPSDGTVLRVGDPATQVALETSGLIDDLDIDVEWANITGGPKTLEAFRADAIDIGSVADIPPLFAHWTGTDVRIVAARETVDPMEHPTYELGVAPGVDVKSIEDLEGKKIAYSPGQAQGALVLNVLREAGLTQDDVEFVEMQSVDDAFSVALASKQVDVAPLGQTLVKTYLAKYEQDGATTIAPGVRDDAWTLYTPTTVLEDADKAAAIKEYVAAWAKAQQWISDNPDEFAEAYYVDHEGLSPEDAQYVVDALGQFTVPTSWDEFIARHQQTVDTLVEAPGPGAAGRGDALRPPLREGDRGGGGGVMTTLTGSPSTPTRALAEAEDVRPTRRRLGPGEPIRFGGLIGIGVLLAAWVVGSATGVLDPRTLTEPWTVLQTAGMLIESGRLQESLVTSGIRAALGLGLGVVAGTILALISGLSRVGESLIDGPIQVKRSIPTLALIPLLILWLGIGEPMKVITIALAVFVPIYIHTHNGLRTIEGRYAELAETLGVSRSEFVRHVVLPGAMPGFLLGLRFAVTSSLLALVVVEVINATSGIGHMITLASNYGQTDIIVVGLVVYALLGVTADAVVRLIERKALSWRRTLAS